jgi:hypothetical protein
MLSAQAMEMCSRVITCTPMFEPTTCDATHHHALKRVVRE